MTRFLQTSGRTGSVSQLYTAAKVAAWANADFEWLTFRAPRELGAALTRLMEAEILGRAPREDSDA